MNKEQAAQKKAEWLSYCLKIGFEKTELDTLGAVWDTFKDEYGDFRATTPNNPPVVKEPSVKTKVDNIVGTFTFDHVNETETYKQNPNFGKSLLAQGEDNKDEADSIQDLCSEAKELVLKLLPSDEYGENGDAERLYNILEELGKKELPIEHDELFTEGRYWNIAQLIASLVYYSQIHEVKGVRPVEFPSHANTWRLVQKWIWKNAKRIEGEYYIDFPTSPL